MNTIDRVRAYAASGLSVVIPPEDARQLCDMAEIAEKRRDAWLEEAAQENRRLQVLTFALIVANALHLVWRIAT